MGRPVLCVYSVSNRVRTGRRFTTLYCGPAINNAAYHIRHLTQRLSPALMCMSEAITSENNLEGFSRKKKRERAPRRLQDVVQKYQNAARVERVSPTTDSLSCVSLF